MSEGWVLNASPLVALAKIRHKRSQSHVETPVDTEFSRLQRA